MKCSIDGCGRDVFVVKRALCYIHYHMWRRRGDFNGVIRSEDTLENRFWAKVDKSSDCWIWTGSTKQGYGAIFDRRAGKVVRATRLVMEMTTGVPVPDGIVVCHTCDNPPCVRPDHLFLGTRVDNATDMYAKGRNPDMRGSKNGRAKISEQDVIAIRADHGSGLSLSACARKYGIAKKSVLDICHRNTWKHVD